MVFNPPIADASPKASTVDAQSTPAKPSAKVEFRGVCKAFGTGSDSTNVLNDVNLRVQQGEFICVLGESGCGKSTLLHMIAGFQFPSGGEVLVDGGPVEGPGYTRGVVFQSPALFPWLTV